MKVKFLLFLSFLFCSHFSKSQSTFAQDSAIWHYGIIENLFYPPEGVLKLKSFGDTTIQGKTCKKIVKTRTSSSGVSTFQGKLYLHSDSNKVYYFINNAFNVLYDFNANAGDNWTVRIPYEEFGFTFNPSDSTRLITVDSVNTIVISSVTLKRQYVSSNIPDWYFRNPIIEQIGGDYMLPGIWGLLDSDLPYLRCYNDSILNYQVPSTPSCDSLITSMPELITETEIRLYPNPSSDYLELSNNLALAPNEQFSICIYNLLGEIVFEKEFSGNHNIIDVSMFNTGLYSVLLHTNKQSFKSKFLKT